MNDFWQHWGPQSPQVTLLARVMLRLVVAAILGGIIGLEREMKRKSAGLRTNMFICFGSAMFTVLSDQLASQWPGDHTRIAAQIIPGIGFIGAGSILHSRGSVTGLTTAATFFVVAGIGMAAGGGLYLSAIFATIVILLALYVLGWAEMRFRLKSLLMTYEITGDSADQIVEAVNQALADEHKVMRTVQLGRVDQHARIQFSVDGTQHEQDNLLRRFRQIAAAGHVECFGAADTE